MGHKQSITGNKGEIISLVNVNKRFENKNVVKNISFCIPKNSVYAIIGPNGAGKTTLLRLILDLLKIDSGTIEYFFDKNSISALLENDYLFEKKTGQENINCFCDYFNIDKVSIAKKTQIYAKTLRLDMDLENEVLEYSKGMKRKLSILITILRDSTLILFDEPTSGLDPQSRLEIRHLFKMLKNEGKTILLTSHDLSEIEKVSDIISVLNNGHIIETFINDGTVGNLEQKFFSVLGGDTSNE
ncbi:MAG: ABC transporter ATP-binding protein [Halanaerobiales bacterium]|nr:ABC transporter ATP-binding protein [Halanaerobiales bacterium]